MCGGNNTLRFSLGKTNVYIGKLGIYAREALKISTIWDEFKDWIILVFDRFYIHIYN